LPLFYQHTINEFTKLAIWKIDEEEFFFLERVPLSRSVTHPHKRLQHLAGRYLLPFLFPDFPLSEIRIADTRKPYLEKEAYHFSISHCGEYAAVIASKTQRVGIDIELVSPKVQKVQDKFLSQQDLFRVQENLDRLRMTVAGIDGKLPTVLWSVKEAVFKWYGKGKVDFKAHIQIGATIRSVGEWLEVPVLFAKIDSQSLPLKARIFDEAGPDALILSWVNTG
jgi:4'-phosphopantetheinyl transferase EntD